MVSVISVIDDENPTVYTACAIVTVTVTLVRQNMNVLFGNETVQDKHETISEEPSTGTNEEQDENEQVKKEEQVKRNFTSY